MFHIPQSTWWINRSVPKQKRGGPSPRPTGPWPKPEKPFAGAAQPPGWGQVRSMSMRVPVPPAPMCPKESRCACTWHLVADEKRLLLETRRSRKSFLFWALPWPTCFFLLLLFVVYAEVAQSKSPCQQLLFFGFARKSQKSPTEKLLFCLESHSVLPLQTEERERERERERCNSGICLGVLPISGGNKKQ